MGEERGRIGSWWGNRRERDHWGDLGVDGWIILGHRISYILLVSLSSPYVHDAWSQEPKTWKVIYAPVVGSKRLIEHCRAGGWQHRPSQRSNELVRTEASNPDINTTAC